LFCRSQCHVDFASLCHRRQEVHNVSKISILDQAREEGFTHLPHQSSGYSTRRLLLLFSASPCPSLTDNCVCWWPSFVLSCFCQKVKPDMILFAIASTVFDASCNSIQLFSLFRSFHLFSYISVEVSCQHLFFFLLY
jgi:hypothetical protein